MNRVSKAILAGLAGLMGVSVVFGCGVRWYLGSAGAHAQIEAALTQRLGGEVHFKELHFSVTKGFGLEGLQVLQSQVSVLEVPEIKARVRWLPLLRKRLWVDSVELESPRFRCAQSEKGEWILPVFRKKIGQSKPPAGVKTAGPRSGAGSWKLGGVKIVNGSAEFSGKKGQLLGTCTGLNYDGTKTPEGLEGMLKISELEWLEWGRLENLSSSFRVLSDRWNLEGIKAGFAEGALTGNLGVSIFKRGTPFEGDLRLDGSDVSLVFSGAGVQGNRLSGLLSGGLKVRGEFSQIKQIQGEGEFSLKDGTLRQMDVLRAIGQVLRVEELERLEFTRAQTRFSMAKQRVSVQELEFDSSRVGITGTGTVQFDGKTGFDVLLGLQETLYKKLPDFVRDSFQEVAAGNRPAVRFKVTGKGGQLKTDLAEKLIGRKLPDQLETLVSGLLGLAKKPERAEGSGGSGEKDGEGKKKRKKSGDSGGGETKTLEGAGESPVSSSPQSPAPKVRLRPSVSSEVGAEPRQTPPSSKPSLDGKVGAENP